jgi:Tol biopolymer transport system component
MRKTRQLALLFFLFILWQSSTAQDIVFGQNKVQYKNFDWYYIQTPNFDIYFYKGEDTLATFAANSLQKAYGEIKEELNYSLANRVPVIIYASHNEFQQTNVISDLIPEGVGGFTEVFKNRIVIPFTGSYEDFRHVLHHELTHAVWFDLLYGNVLRSLLSTDALFRPPLWFSEGYAEFSSRHGWDLEADMYMRDAVIQGYLPPLDQLDGFLAYKGGQSACEFISEKYGAQKISEILNKGKVVILMERAVKSSLGISLKNLSEDWQKSMRRVYWPEIADRKEPAEVATALTDHTKDGSMFNQQPAWSPKGDRLAFFSDKNNPRNGYSDRFNEVFIISTINGKLISRLVKAERSGDLESLHSYLSGLTWSPDGSELAFVGKSNGHDMLFIYDADTGRRREKIDVGMEALRDPAWSRDGSKMAMDGSKNGFTDLYIYDFKTEKLQRLMHDKYDDHFPSWSNDNRYLAFASDRPASGDTSNDRSYGDYNIFLYDTQSGDISNLVNSPYKDDQPVFSPDGARIAFISNRNGIDNIYLYEMADGNTYPVTNIISGAFTPSWSPDGDQLAFSAFFKYGFDIYILKNIKDVADDSGLLKPTHFMEKIRSGQKDFFVPAAPVATSDTTRAGSDTIGTVRPSDFSTYVFHTGEQAITERTTGEKPDTLQPAEKADTTLAGIDTLKYMMPDGNYKQNHYRLKFAPELVTGGLTYDNFYGLQGQSYLAISDLLGNHHFYIYTDLVNTIDQSNFQVAYSYTARRPDYMAAVFHFKNLYYDDYHGFFFSDRVYGAQGYVAYPFSKFSRLDLTLSQITVSRENYTAAELAPEFPDRTTNLLISSLSFTNDAVIWGLTGPVGGQRYLVKYDQSLKTVGTGLSFSALEFDYRRYWFFLGRYNLAMRLGGGFSNGRDAKVYYIGGTSNWISPTTTKGDIYSVSDIYINELIVPVRGYNYFSQAGNRYGIFNLEFRYPFVDYLKLHFPLPITLAQVSGAIFWDMGTTWKGGGGDFYENMHLHNPYLPTSPDSSSSGDILAGFGLGPRINLGIFVLRVDLAWATNLDHVAKKPRWYFSLGAEF